MAEIISKIKVLVVDDSAFMRVAIKKMMEEDDYITVIDTAKNGAEALKKIRDLKPDLVTMDIEMPVMDGLTALKRVMKENPLPVIMISALTEEGAEATFKALELGAVDFIPKGGKSYINLDIIKIGEQLRGKVRAIVSRTRMRGVQNGLRSYSSPVKTARNSNKEIPAVRVKRTGHCNLVTIGISTGGPLALNELISHFPEDFASSILIVQHMPPAFTGPFARRLNSKAKISVKECVDGEKIEPGCAYVAPGGMHLKIKRTSSGILQANLDNEPRDKLFIPSVDVLMLSAAENYRERILGVIMTGMGNDGLEGMKAIKSKNGITVAQDEDSCVVYGMPKVCVEEGIIDEIAPLRKLAEVITKYAG